MADFARCARAWRCPATPRRSAPAATRRCRRARRRASLARPLPQNDASGVADQRPRTGRRPPSGGRRRQTHGAPAAGTDRTAGGWTKAGSSRACADTRRIGCRQQRPVTARRRPITPGRHHRCHRRRRRGPAACGSVQRPALGDGRLRRRRSGSARDRGRRSVSSDRRARRRRASAAPRRRLDGRVTGRVGVARVGRSRRRRRSCRPVVLRRRRVGAAPDFGSPPPSPRECPAVARVARRRSR